MDFVDRKACERKRSNKAWKHWTPLFLGFLSGLRGHDSRVVCKDRDAAGKRGSVPEAQAP